MKFKDVAHLYIGCKVKSEKSKNVYDLDSDVYHHLVVKGYPLKPLLYPLSAMTEEQREVYWDLLTELGVDKELTTIYYSVSPEAYKYLLDNHFDLYKLIEQGEAIDVTTLEVNPYK